MSLSFAGSNDRSIVDEYGRPRDATSVGTSYGDFRTGVSARYERSYRWWAGFSASYGESAWNQIYNSKEPAFSYFQRVAIPAEIHDLSGAYLVHGKAWRYGLQPYAELGMGALIFDYQGGAKGNVPTALTATQTRFAGNAAVGVTMDLKKRFGLRAGYRTLAYISPDFHTGGVGYKQYTVMQQPILGMFLRF